VSLPHTKYALPSYYILASAEASSNLSRYNGIHYGYNALEEEHENKVDKSLEWVYLKSRSLGFGDEVKRRILLGAFTTSRASYSSYYHKALLLRSLVHDDFQRVFNNHSVHVLLTPTTPSPPFPVTPAISDPLGEYLNDVMTIPASLAGLPAISVPVALMDIQNETNLPNLRPIQVPVGLQLVGNAWHDWTVLRVAECLENNGVFSSHNNQGNKRIKPPIT